jgi:hypothetical protein
METQNNLDLAKFNREFEEKEKERIKFKPIDEPRIDIKKSPKLNQIEKIILAMRLVFEILLDRITKGVNPLPEILDKEELTVGLIALCIFIGALTLLLGGIMKD